jgi:sulfide dehydrogenase cytochrome subunit
MNALRIAAAVTVALLLMPDLIVPSRAAADPPPGATSCSGCHGERANANSPIPGITGRNAEDILTAMTAFRDGSRPVTVMNRIAKGFTDDELRPIAAWLAAQK